MVILLNRPVAGFTSGQLCERYERWDGVQITVVQLRPGLRVWLRNQDFRNPEDEPRSDPLRDLAVSLGIELLPEE